jgi:thiamine biosynthesis protein ThiS
MAALKERLCATARTRSFAMCHRTKLNQNQNKINVTVNKEETVLPEGTTMVQLLKLRGIKSRSSVWVNGNQLLLAEYPTWILQEGDVVKILRVVAGG